MKGKLITFEGGEGSGKSTVSKFVFEKLKSKKIPCIWTREPGGTPSAEKIRNILVNSSTDRLEPITELLLHYAARAEHYNNFIKPEIEKGRIVICDRFYDSTTAYQGYGHKLDLKKVEKIRELVLGKFKPHLTFIMHIPAEDGLKRAGKRETITKSNENRYEMMDINFHKRLEKGFLAIAKKEPKRCIVIDSRKPLDIVCKEVWKRLEPRV